MKLGIIGLGGIGQSVLNILQANTHTPYQQLSVLVRSGRGNATRQILQPFANLANTITVHENLNDFMASPPDITAECAGQQAVRDYIPTVLAGGSHVIMASVGTLADNDFYNSLHQTATENNSRIIIPAGAIGGIDTLAAAKLSGIEQVIYTGKKPPNAWRGTPAETMVDLESLTEPTVIFNGNARDVSKQYPKNANVCATLALAGIGFDNTQVTLIADPKATTNTHHYQVISQAVNYTIDLTAIPSPQNPKTSASTAYSIAREIINYSGHVII